MNECVLKGDWAPIDKISPKDHEIMPKKKKAHKSGHNEPAPTIHWMTIITHVWMNLNWVNIWFHLRNQFCKK